MEPDHLSSGKLIVICGPTATGKSALAVELAKAVNGEIISADSRQVYRGLDIGSAKITPEEMQGIPHHLIDIADPFQVFTVSDFQKLAQEKIAAIHARGKLPIICGGTGMYISAVIDNHTFPEVPPNESLRAELEKMNTDELMAKLTVIDSASAERIDSKNRVRVIRAIEIATAIGSVPKQELPKSPYDLLMIGLTLPKEEIIPRITLRIEERIPALFDEIKKLHEGGISFERLESFGLEYRHGSEYVQGKISLEIFKETLATKTWQFVKRQMTWFKRDTRIHWAHPISDQQKILKLVQDFLQK